MTSIKAHNLVCPIDGEKLQQVDHQLVCDNGHTFDIARQGYVNLLPVQHKRSKQPGDSKAMVLARQQHLNTGIYQKISDKVTGTVVAHIINDNDVCILDAGCGEGYYFDALLTSLVQEDGNNNLCFIGLDISKEAIIQATKRNQNIAWVVGTNRHPPLAKESVDIILCLFGFISTEGFTNILKPGGKIIMVDAGVGHLSELREIIYPEIKTKSASITTLAEHPKYSLLSTENLQYKAKLYNNQQVNNLLLMTPHFYRASKAGREVASNLKSLDISVDVIFSVWQKHEFVAED